MPMISASHWNGYLVRTFVACRAGAVMGYLRDHSLGKPLGAEDKGAPARRGRTSVHAQAGARTRKRTGALHDPAHAAASALPVGCRQGVGMTRRVTPAALGPTMAPTGPGPYRSYLAC